MDTPISALPSRFMENGLLPSPSNFYPDWPFGGRDSAGGGGGGNMLPSPLTFQTPVNAHGPSFRDDEGSAGKRKLGEGAGEGNGKRIKVE
jgi:MADS-box transcription factor